MESSRFLLCRGFVQVDLVVLILAARALVRFVRVVRPKAKASRPRTRLSLLLLLLLILMLRRFGRLLLILLRIQLLLLTGVLIVTLLLRMTLPRRRGERVAIMRSHLPC